MPNYNPPIRGVQYILSISLPSQVDPRLMQTNPTLAAGDVLISKDNGATGNLGTLPTVTPAGGKIVKITVSATEMDADNVDIVFVDVAGAEWCDVKISIQPCSLGFPAATTDAAATTTVFTTSLTQADDHFNNSYILFTDGTLQGQSRKISDFANTNGVITLAVALTSAPANGTPFIILGRSE